jgi:hypothetical protein
VKFIDDELGETTVAASEADDEYGRGKGKHRCGAIWFGERIEHCAVCCQTFSGETTGKAHRVGDFEDGTRRCLTSDELSALGLWIETNPYGTDVWHGSPNKRGVQKRHPRKASA